MSTPLPPASPAPPVPPTAGGPSAAPPPAGPGILALRVVGTLVVVLVIAVASVNVVARFFHERRVETAVYAQPLTAISVGTTTGDIRVSAGAAGSPVVVRRTLDSTLGTAESAEQVTDGQLDVTARCSAAAWIASGCEVSYDVTVPPGLAVRLDSHTGKIDVVGVSGDLTASEHTGDIDVRDIRSPRVDLASSTGDLTLQFAAAPLDVRTSASTGDVTVAVPPDGTTYDVQVSTTTGERNVSVPLRTGGDRRIVARTSTGDVDVRAQAPGAPGS